MNPSDQRLALEKLYFKTTEVVLYKSSLIFPTAVFVEGKL